jgi:hypothetical protein
MFRLSNGLGIASIHRVDERDYASRNAISMLSRENECSLVVPISIPHTLCSDRVASSSAHALKSPSIPRPRSLCDDSPLKVPHRRPSISALAFPHPYGHHIFCSRLPSAMRSIPLSFVPLYSCARLRNEKSVRRTRFASMKSGRSKLCGVEIAGSSRFCARDSPRSV